MMACGGQAVALDEQDALHQVLFSHLRPCFSAIRSVFGFLVWLDGSQMNRLLERERGTGYSHTKIESRDKKGIRHPGPRRGLRFLAWWPDRGAESAQHQHLRPIRALPQAQTTCQHPSHPVPADVSTGLWNPLLKPRTNTNHALRGKVHSDRGLESVSETVTWAGRRRQKPGTSPKTARHGFPHHQQFASSGRKQPGLPGAGRVPTARPTGAGLMERVG